MEWIDVNDSLPNYYAPVLVYCTKTTNTDMIIVVAWRATDDTESLWTIYESDLLVKVTHWAELPQPPK